MAKISDSINKGIFYAERGDYPRALETFQDLYAKQPDNPDILFNYGRLLNDLRDCGTAASVLERLASIRPDCKNGKVALSFAYLHLKKPDEAKALVEEARTIDPGNIDLLRYLGRIYAEMGDLDTALDIFHEAEGIEKNMRNILYGIALVAYKQEKYSEASNYLRRIIDQGVDDQIDTLAKDMQREIAEKEFSKDGLRMDVVYYCLGALETFDDMSYGQIEDTTFEIAMMAKDGLDPLNHTTTHPLSIVAGEFTAVQLFCFMYVGFKIIKPDIDIGFDLSKEYAAAQAMKNA